MIVYTSISSPMLQLFRQMIPEAQVIPTPKPLNNNLAGDILFLISSDTMVRGIDTEEVFPNFPIVEGVF